MFSKLFVDNGLSLDRLRALVEVGAAGGMSLAAGGDPVRQSQYSRQIKELEDFFDTGLIERHGRGIRLTAKGRELALISRFFLLGLSNFQNGCHRGGQVFRVGANAVVVERFLIPALARRAAEDPMRLGVETAEDREIERRLRDLTLDFGVVSTTPLGRPLQTRIWKRWSRVLWVPKSMAKSAAKAADAWRAGHLPWCGLEGDSSADEIGTTSEHREPAIQCSTFLEVRAAVETGRMAGILPDFLGCRAIECWQIPWPAGRSACQYAVAWNPRLLRLNPHAAHLRDWLPKALSDVE
jgi:DNA-binding transcriptional LysR family regulator